MSVKTTGCANAHSHIGKTAESVDRIPKGHLVVGRVIATVESTVEGVAQPSMASAAVRAAR
jgi:hypothetical protein